MGLPVCEVLGAGRAAAGRLASAGAGAARELAAGARVLAPQRLAGGPARQPEPVAFIVLGPGARADRITTSLLLREASAVVAGARGARVAARWRFAAGRERLALARLVDGGAEPVSGRSEVGRMAPPVVVVERAAA